MKSRFAVVVFMFFCGLFSGCHHNQDQPAPTKPTWQLADTLAQDITKLMVDGHLHEKGFLAAVTPAGIWTYDTLMQYPSLHGAPETSGPVRFLTQTISINRDLNLAYDPVWNSRYLLISQPGDSNLSLFDYSALIGRSGMQVPLSALGAGYSSAARIYSATGAKPFAAFNDANQCLIPIGDTEPGYTNTGLSYALLTINQNQLNASGFGTDALVSAKKIRPLADYLVVDGTQKLPNPVVAAAFGYKDRFFVGLENDSHRNNMILADGTVRPLPFAQPARYFTFQSRLYAIMDVAASTMQVMSSADAGDSWQNAFTIKGSTYADALTFNEIDHQLYAFANQQLWQVNAQTGTFTEVSVAGLEKSRISAVVRYGSWLYAMTLSGLYRIKATDFQALISQ